MSKYNTNIGIKYIAICAAKASNTIAGISNIINNGMQTMTRKSINGVIISYSL